MSLSETKRERVSPWEYLGDLAAEIVKLTGNRDASIQEIAAHIRQQEQSRTDESDSAFRPGKGDGGGVDA